jgi:hypothetical protein
MSELDRERIAGKARRAASRDSRAFRLGVKARRNCSRIAREPPGCGDRLDARAKQIQIRTRRSHSSRRAVREYMSGCVNFWKSFSEKRKSAGVRLIHPSDIGGFRLR